MILDASEGLYIYIYIHIEISYQTDGDVCSSHAEFGESRPSNLVASVLHIHIC